MRRGLLLASVGAALVVVLAGTGIYLRFRNTPIPNEHSGEWVFKDGHKEHGHDRQGREFLVTHARLYLHRDTGHLLEVHEVFGKTVLKMWGSQRGRMVALLDDTGKWRQTVADGVQTLSVHEGGELRALRLILRNSEGCIVAKRLVGRQTSAL